MKKLNLTRLNLVGIGVRSTFRLRKGRKRRGKKNRTREAQLTCEPEYRVFM